MTVLAKALDGGGPGTVIIHDGVEWTRARLAQQAETFCAALSGLTVSRLLYRSDHPADLLIALLAAERLDLALLLAHAHMPEAQVDQWASEYGLTALAGESQTIVPLSDRGEAARPITEPGIYLMTSGTTGAPKIVRHSPATLAGRIRRPPGGSFEGQRWLLTYGTTTFAGIQVLLTALLTGGTLVGTSSRRVPDLLDAAARHRVHNISGTPTFWRSLLVAVGGGGRGLESVRQITLGGELVDQKTLDRMKTSFPTARITQIYATTEAGAVFAVNDGRAGFPATWLDHAVDGVELAVVDGILRVRTPRRMSRYLSPHGNPVSSDGWLTTGDLVRREGDRAYFAGRTDEVLNIGGAKVSPAEVEAVLLAIEGVAEVRVSGARNPISGQVVMAEVVCTPGADPVAVRDRVFRQSAAALPSQSVPRVVRVVERIAIGVSGKKAPPLRRDSSGT